MLLIHHIAKHGDGSPRGHSVLNGTLDMCLSLAPKGNDGVIRGKLTKNRNGTTDRDITFRFEAVELGQDEDGDAVTAPRAIELDPLDSAAAALPKLSPGATNALCLLYRWQRAVSLFRRTRGGPVATTSACLRGRQS